MLGLMVSTISKRAYLRTFLAADCGLPLPGLSLVVLARSKWSKHVDVVGELVQHVRLNGGIHQAIFGLVPVVVVNAVVNDGEADGALEHRQVGRRKGSHFATRQVLDRRRGRPMVPMCGTLARRGEQADHKGGIKPRHGVRLFQVSRHEQLRDEPVHVILLPAVGDLTLVGLKQPRRRRMSAREPQERFDGLTEHRPGILGTRKGRIAFRILAGRRIPLVDAHKEGFR
jgi:hypothetical protein